jgi:hypothetical protein
MVFIRSRNGLPVGDLVQADNHKKIRLPGESRDPFLSRFVTDGWIPAFTGKRIKATPGFGAVVTPRGCS